MQPPRYSRSEGRSGRSRRRGTATNRRWRSVALFGPWRQTIDLWALLFLLVVVALGGGSSFADVTSLLYVRPVALCCLILFALTSAPIKWHTYRAPMVLLALYAALMLIQLVPLPPAIWTALPGRQPYAGVMALAGMPQPWRPLSLTPDLTANALVALIVPAAVLIGVSKLRRDQRDTLVPVLVILCVISALVGIAQFAGGKDSPLYLYRFTYEDFPVGLLSNRNHQAALLALSFPALRVWTLMPTANRSWERSRGWVALALGVLIIPMVLATGSRAGIALMVIGIVAAFLLFPVDRGRASRPKGWQRPLIGVALGVVALTLVLATYVLGRAASIERLLALSTQSDQRFQYAPTVIRIVRNTFPVGTGFGSFDPVFRQYEPDAILISSYFNHAHNELLELVIMAGLPGLLLLAGLLIWWAVRTIGAMRDDARNSRHVRLGSCIVAFLLLASLVDYPLRAPLMAAVFALGCAWLCDRDDRNPDEGATTPAS